MPAPEIAAAIAAMPVDDVGGKYAKAIAVLVALHWAEPDGTVLVRQVDVAELTGFSERTIRDALAVLRDRGLIESTAAIACRFTVDRPARGAGDDRHALPVDRHAAPVPARGAAGTPRRSPARPAGDRHAAPVGPARGAGPVSVQTSSLSPPPPGLTSLEEGDARASDRHAAPPAPGAGQEWMPTAAEMKTIRWLQERALPLRMPDGTDLRPEWIAALRWLAPTEADEIRASMVGDLPSAFRAAALPWEPTRESRARHAVALVRALDGAEADARREAAGAEAEREKVERAEIERKRREEAETGTFLEQARALLATIDADERRRDGMSERTMDLVRVVRFQASIGRVTGAAIGSARLAWNETREAPPREAAAVAAETTPTPPPNPGHPAILDRDHPLVVLDDDAPPVDEDPVVEVIRGFLKRLAVQGSAAGPDAVDAWLAHLVNAGAAMTSGDALAYLDLAVRIANQRGIVVLTPDDVPSQAMVAWATTAAEAVAS